MQEKFTLCFCELKDCIFYRPAPESERKCRCAHPDKPQHLSQLVCPLYRMDWQKKTAQATSIMARKPHDKYGADE